MKTKENISKFMRFLEVVSSILAITSKYLLSVNSIWGWSLGAAGYAIITGYNFKRKVPIVASLTAGLMLLLLYGWYKWFIDVKGLQTLDYIVIVLTLVFALSIGYNQYKSKTPLWFPQVISTVFFMGGFILIGLGSLLGWYGLLLGHVVIGYIYYKKRAFIYVLVQIISIYIALSKLYDLPMLF